MNNKSKTIAIIPARSGSKRLPKKNIKDFGGKPLICWTIEAAITSHNIDDVVVSTDDTDIIKLVKNVHTFGLTPKRMRIL